MIFYHLSFNIWTVNQALSFIIHTTPHICLKKNHWKAITHLQINRSFQSDITNIISKIKQWNYCDRKAFIWKRFAKASFQIFLFVQSYLYIICPLHVISLIYQSHIVCEEQIYIFRRQNLSKKNIDIFSEVETFCDKYTKCLQHHLMFIRWIDSG